MNKISVAFYNCENFFDTIHSPGKEDEEFTPIGKYHYTQKIYEQKLHNIATVIQNIAGDDGPAIMGLAEVENETVLHDLVAQPEIARRSYHYVLLRGADKRGINVAMLYNPRYFTLLGSAALPVIFDPAVSVEDTGKLTTRDVLHVSGVLAGDSVHVFINHWPSRTGGVADSGPRRAAAALVNRAAIDALIKKEHQPKIIVMGDLNDNPADSCVVAVLGAKGEKGSALYNPFAAIFKSNAGTEYYNGSWNLFDQIIISGSFLQVDRKGLYYDSAGIYQLDFLISHNKRHKGEPLRSFVGAYWLNGYSDHFPVLLYFKKEQ